MKATGSVYDGYLPAMGELHDVRRRPQVFEGQHGYLLPASWSLAGCQWQPELQTTEQLPRHPHIALNIRTCASCLTAAMHCNDVMLSCASGPFCADNAATMTTAALTLKVRLCNNVNGPLKTLGRVASLYQPLSCEKQNRRVVKRLSCHQHKTAFTNTRPYAIFHTSVSGPSRVVGCKVWGSASGYTTPSSSHTRASTEAASYRRT